MKCIQDESAGSLGLGAAGAAGTAPARGGGRGARDSVAAGSQAPASASRAGSTPHAWRRKGAGRSREPGRASRASARRRWLGLREGEECRTECKLRGSRRDSAARSTSTKGARDCDGTRCYAPRTGAQVGRVEKGESGSSAAGCGYAPGGAERAVSGGRTKTLVRSGRKRLTETLDGNACPPRTPNKLET